MAQPRGPLLSPGPGTPILIGGVYNAIPPSPADQQGLALQLDSQGNLLVNVVVGAVTITSIAGSLANNSAAPIANNLGVLPAVASSAAPILGEGKQVLLSTDLAGNLRVIGAPPPANASTNITQVGGATFALGQQLAAASLPVVLTAAQLSTLTPLSTVAVTQGTSPWVVSGTVTITPSGLQNVNVTQWNSVALGSPSAYGVAPGAVNVIGVNAFITNTPAVTLASTTITGTVAVTQSTSPWVVSLASTTVTNTVAENLVQVAGVTLGATAVTAYGTAPAAANVPGVNAFITNTPAVTLASTTITGNVTVVQPTGTNLHVVLDSGTTVVTQPTAANLNATVVGTLTNNNAAPAATNVGALVARANAAAPSWTEGNQVLLSEDLTGNLRVITGTGSTTAVTGNVTVVQPTGTNLHIVVDSGTLTTVSTVTAVTAITNALPAGANIIGKVDILGNAGAIMDGVNTAATAPANGLLGLGIFNSTLPTLTTGQSAGIQVDAKGQQLIDLNYVAGVALGATAIVNYGSTPAAVAVPAVNAFITNTPAVTLASTTITGNVTVVQPTGTNLHIVVDSGTLTAVTTITNAVTVVGATTPADAQANPTTAVITESFNVGFNGATWDRLRTVSAAGAGLGMLKVGISGATATTLDAVTTAATAPAGGLATLVEYLSTPPTVTTGQSVMMQSDSKGSLYVNTEGRKTTYHASASFIPVTGATDIVTIIGSATTIVRITSISYDAVATSATAATLSIIKRSAADTTGTKATVTAVPLDSTDAAATAVVSTYTANPGALGAAVGNVITDLITFTTPTTAPPGPNHVWNFGDKNGQAIVLRGVAENLAINLNAPTLAAGQVFTFYIEWTESTA